MSEKDKDIVALRACLDIYRDFSHEEVKELAPSIRNAWLVGQGLDSHNNSAQITGTPIA